MCLFELYTAADTLDVYGNTLVTDCDSGDIKEFSNSGTTVWSYSHPGNNSNIARAQKYDIDHFEQETLLGDLNDDNILNVLDVIILVNMDLGNTEIDLNGDMNGDNGINILDVVLLVNLILS